jgi:hypothetical protein
MNMYKFIREGQEWYIDLPEYLVGGGSKGDLQMVQGADSMLDMISGGVAEVSLLLDRVYFSGSDKLVLTERCDPYIGGGYYYLQTFEGKEINKTMWLCAVTEYVFGDLPEEIFIKRV